MWRSRVGALTARAMQSPLVKSSGIYVSTNVLNRAFPFFLIPILTRYLSPADFGRAAMFTIAVNLTTPIVGLNTDTAVARQFFERDEIDFPNYIANCLYVLVATAAFAALVLLLFAEPVGRLLSLPPEWIWAVVAVAIGKYLMSVVLVLFQVRDKARSYGAFFLSQTLLAFALSIILIVGYGWGWQGRVVGEVFSVVLMAIVGLVMLVRGRWIKPGVNKRYLEHALKFGGGLVPHLYGGQLIVASDRILVNTLIGVAAAGLYTVGAQIAMIITVLESSFNQAWTPWLFGRLKLNDPSVLVGIRKFSRIYNVSIIGVALSLGLLSPWLLGFFVGRDFRSASIYIFWLAIGNAFGGMYKMVVNPIFYMNKTHLLAMVTFTSGVLNVGLAYFLIKRHGAVGAAQAAAASLFVSYVLTSLLSKSLLKKWVREATATPSVA